MSQKSDTFSYFVLSILFFLASNKIVAFINYVKLCKYALNISGKWILSDGGGRRTSRDPENTTVATLR